VLGGVLPDEYNYQVAIFVSAVIQSVGIVIFVVFLHCQSSLGMKKSLHEYDQGVLPNNNMT